MTCIAVTVLAGKVTQLRPKTAEIPLWAQSCDRNCPKTVTALHLSKPSPTSPQVPPVLVCCGLGIRLPSSHHPSLWSFPLCCPSVFFLHALTSRLCNPPPSRRVPWSLALYGSGVSWCVRMFYGCGMAAGAGISGGKGEVINNIMR